MDEMVLEELTSWQIPQKDLYYGHFYIFSRLVFHKVLTTFLNFSVLLKFFSV